jgi:pyruvate dehydrogenase E1 component alpha subunit
MATTAGAARSPRGTARGAKASAIVATADKAELLGLYREMLLIRRFEEKAGQLYGMGLIGGFCHLYIGQEAVVVGMQMTLKPGTCWSARWTRAR